jgi:hypothetical protein
MPAGASSLHATTPYRAFGDLSGADDCQYETAANLVLSRWPAAHITTAEVESAYDKFGGAFEGQSVTSDGGSTWTLTGLWAGQNFLLDQGFAGHRAQSITEVTTRAQMVSAANAGGLEVTVMGPTMQHMFAIVHANAREVTQVDTGTVTHITWTQLIWEYTHVVNADGTISLNSETLAFYWVRWSHSA